MSFYGRPARGQEHLFYSTKTVTFLSFHYCFIVSSRLSKRSLCVCSMIETQIFVTKTRQLASNTLVNRMQKMKKFFAVVLKALAGVGLEEIPRRKIWLDSKVQGVHVKFVWEIIVTTSQFSCSSSPSKHVCVYSMVDGVTATISFSYLRHAKMRDHPKNDVFCSNTIFRHKRDSKESIK